MTTHSPAPSGLTTSDGERSGRGFHTLEVAEVIQETSDAKSFVLNVPESLRDTFAYRAGQFCTFRVRIDRDVHLRCYSMSSSPLTGSGLTVTVKRVEGGAVSGWLLDHVEVGDSLEASRPAGVFCIKDRDTPITAFCGGSGVTPVMSIIRQVLVENRRSVRVLYANRHPDSVIFKASLSDLTGRYPGQISVRHHFDSVDGFLGVTDIAGFALGSPIESDFYICGPTPFMDLVESTLLDCGVGPDRIMIERFVDSHIEDGPLDDTDRTVEVVIGGEMSTVAYRDGETILEAARRAHLHPPFSCQAGNCATCMAIVRQGSATMRANNALTAQEVAEGWVLTCQAVPTSPTVTVEYEAF